MGYLIDTCIWVDIERGTLAPADVSSFTGIDAIYISPVTIAELKFGVENTSDMNIRKSVRQRFCVLSESQSCVSMKQPVKSLEVWQPR
jgi:predicted nucleic acid-binding protein